MVTSLSIGTGGLGRYGNQLYTIAGVIGIATKNGLQYGFPKWKNYDNALFGGEITDYNEWFVNPLPSIPDGRQWQEYPYFWGYRDIQLSSGDWNIHAHLQSPKFFEHCMDEIRFYFTMKDEPPQNDCVAIHFRAGDYTEGGYHPRCSTEYYREAIKLMPANSKYIVFTDDIEAAKERIGLNCEYRSNHYLEDFKLMKRCRNFIIANSSFSAMAALLAEHPEKKVVAPRRWFGEGVDLETKDIYHKDWLIL
jgi:hypothetical protein